MKYTSALISDARNKLGGDVFARNRAGLYVRAKVTPVNRQTTRQQANRANFASYATAFRSLSAAQIMGWNTLASGSTLVDTLGNSYRPTGLQMYISCNRNLWLVGQAGISTAPTVKPSFPVILSGTSYVEVLAGAFITMDIGVTSAAFAAYANIQVSVASNLSAGVNFIGPSLYRSLGTCNTHTSGLLVFTTKWTAVLGVPAVGSTNGIRARWVDFATGYASMPETILVTTTIY